MSVNQRNTLGLKISIKIGGANLLMCLNVLLLFVGGTTAEGMMMEGDMMFPAGTPQIKKYEVISWPNNIVVYKFDPKLPSSVRGIFLKAIDHISGRTCMRFKERTTESDYINVTQVTGCNSYIGKIRGPQRLSLAQGCQSLGIHVHELMHAMGFVHEQSRPDRDDYVTIHWNNIDEKHEHNFVKHDIGKVAAFGLAYDYASLMHYNRKDFSKNEGDTITPKKSGVKIGQRDGLSELDVKKVNKMYCGNTIGIRIKNVFYETYLDAQVSSSGERPVMTSSYNVGENKQWTVDWSAFQDVNKGSTLVPWSQDGNPVKVMSEVVDLSSVVVGAGNEGSNQKWRGKQIAGAWQIINVQTGKCLRSMGGGQAKTVECNSYCTKMRWNIYYATHTQ